MKKLMIAALVVCATLMCSAQETTHLLFEFVNVPEGQGGNYMDVEEFWSKIHKERIKAGEINGWDLWALKPSAQRHQYLIVQEYSDPSKMMKGMSDADFDKYMKLAYPNISEADLNEQMEATWKSRDINGHVYVQILGGTEGDVDFKPGILTSMDFMKVDVNEPGSYTTYENAEMEVFKPIHQNDVNNGNKMNWGLGRIISPVGSDTFASHVTWNFYKDWPAYFKTDGWNSEPLSEEMSKKVAEGLQTRDMRWSYMCELVMSFR